MGTTDLNALGLPWGRVQFQELLLVAAGLKPACRLRLRRDHLPALNDTLKRLSLKMIAGYDAIISRPVSGRQGYSEWCERAAASPRLNESCYAYIAADGSLGLKLRRMDESQNDKDVGEILGYPACCIKAFCEAMEADERGSDPVLSRYADASPVSWYMNVSLLCFDFSLLTHIPCHQNCETSMEMARTYFAHMNAQRPSAAEEVRSMLSRWVMHSQALGVLAFSADKHSDDRCSTLEVKEIAASQPESVLGRIVGVNTIITSDDDGISVDNCYLTRRQVKLFHYC